MVKLALIIGITGQDGAYLARHLKTEGYTVVGTTRQLQGTHLGALQRLGVVDSISLLALDPLDPFAVSRVLADVSPNEIYNLSGQSSVATSFSSPAETIRSLAMGTLNLLEAIRSVLPTARFFSAGSSEAFGDTKEAARESTPLAPRSPYACGKAAAIQMVSVYRKAYGLFVCSGLTFNHESPLRPESYFTQKVARAVARMVRGSNERLALGNLAAERDFGWAPEFVCAFHQMLQLDEPVDLVLATGTRTSLHSLVDAALRESGLRTEDRVVFDPSLERPADIQVSVGDPSLAARLIGWHPTIAGIAVVVEMLYDELRRGLR
jgi:GDPmannose 4,6-dehydratase